jgi:hypothetical protein
MALMWLIDKLQRVKVYLQYPDGEMVSWTPVMLLRDRRVLLPKEPVVDVDTFIRICEGRLDERP